MNEILPSSEELVNYIYEYAKDNSHLSRLELSITPEEAIRLCEHKYFDGGGLRRNGTAYLYGVRLDVK